MCDAYAKCYQKIKHVKKPLLITASVVLTNKTSTSSFLFTPSLTMLRKLVWPV